jgi:ribonuclease HI
MEWPQRWVWGSLYTSWIATSFNSKQIMEKCTNNLGELNALFFLLTFALKMHLSSLQVMGDSLLMIN